MIEHEYTSDLLGLLMRQLQTETIEARAELAAVVVGLGQVSPTARTLAKAAEEIGLARMHWDAGLIAPAFLQMQSAADRLDRVALRFWLRPRTQDLANHASVKAEALAAEIRSFVYVA